MGERDSERECLRRKSKRNLILRESQLRGRRKIETKTKIAYSALGLEGWGVGVRRTTEDFPPFPNREYIFIISFMNETVILAVVVEC